MGVTLGHNQYGKAETRVVRVFRDSDPHEIVDYNVSVAHTGDFTDVHLVGDNSKCLTTDATKNTVYAFAKEYPDAVRQPESFGIALAKHFVEDVEQVSRCRVKLEMYPWKRLENPHAFVRDGGLVRTATVTYEGGVAHVVSGVQDLIVLKTTDSEFFDFYTERYTTLAPTHDRVMATSVTAQWLHALPTEGGADVDWQASYDQVISTLSTTFANHHSLALQQTAYSIGEAIITEQPSIGEFRFSMPNKHHFVVDLSPYDLENPNEVFNADDRPYGLIEGTVLAEGATASTIAFDPGMGW